MKKASLLLALILLFLATRDPFSPQAIEAPLLEESSSSYAEEIERALLQQYQFLSEGRQSYVFVSRDGKHVLKFFKHAYYALPWYTSLLPETWRQKEIKKRSDRKRYYASGYPLAGAFFQERTELLLVHLGKTDTALPKIKLKGRYPKTYEIDLNTTPFVLQKKGELLYPSLQRLYEREGIQGVENGVLQFLTLIFERLEKNILDKDHHIAGNFGMCEGKVIDLDPGRYVYTPDLTLEEWDREWVGSTYKLRKWIGQNFPEALPYFDETNRQYIEKKHVSASL